ncbi:MAG TPA: hypothetical protein ENN21_00380 [Spirochaetes bacterium]|nr:hypothetical protein [Spirochaetota bacterium]
MPKPRAVAALLFLLLLPCCGPKPHAEFKVVPERFDLAAAAGATQYLLLEVQIPGGGYIYGNPKGPGTGRATELTARSTGRLVFGRTGFRPPEKHYGPGEKEHVWIYRHETGLVLPLTVAMGTPTGTYGTSITFEALLCDADTCMPLVKDIPVSVRVVRSEELNRKETAGPPEGFIFPDGPADREVPAAGEKKSAREESLPAFDPHYITRGGVAGVIQAILFGLLAGFLLNFMPCVLPVVSLKVMGLVKHARDEKGAQIRMGLFFTLGILVSFAVLAALAAYAGYNWGELFQKKEFLIGMITVVFALALSMFHVYTLPVPSFAGRLSRERDNPYIDSFMKGLLATLLATPCSGPFLGGTLAWALSQPPFIVFIIFMSVGMGMAAPYLVFAVNPGLLRFIPKPGDWMIAFEGIMGILLLGTVVYLLGILNKDMIMPVLWFLFFTGAGLWQFGHYGSPVRSRVFRALSAAVLALFVVGGWFWFPGAGGDSEKDTLIKTENFSMAALYGARDDGKIAVVNFTADWCPNCKLVEARVLHSPEVAALMKESGARLFTADLTRENPGASALLAALGSRSIPFLAVFPPGVNFSRPYCLRDIYSRSDAREAMLKARQASGVEGNKK